MLSRPDYYQHMCQAVEWGYLCQIVSRSRTRILRFCHTRLFPSTKKYLITDKSNVICCTHLTLGVPSASCEKGCVMGKLLKDRIKWWIVNPET